MWLGHTACASSAGRLFRLRFRALMSTPTIACDQTMTSMLLIALATIGVSYRCLVLIDLLNWRGDHWSVHKQAHTHVPHTHTRTYANSNFETDCKRFCQPTSLITEYNGIKVKVVAITHPCPPTYTTPAYTQNEICPKTTKYKATIHKSCRKLGPRNGSASTYYIML